jgi:hypothetical protein
MRYFIVVISATTTGSEEEVGKAHRKPLVASHFQLTAQCSHNTFTLNSGKLSVVVQYLRLFLLQQHSISPGNLHTPLDLLKERKREG